MLSFMLKFCCDLLICICLIHEHCNLAQKKTCKSEDYCVTMSLNLERCNAVFRCNLLLCWTPLTRWHWAHDNEKWFISIFNQIDQNNTRLMITMNLLLCYIFLQGHSALCTKTFTLCCVCAAAATVFAFLKVSQKSYCMMFALSQPAAIRYCRICLNTHREKLIFYTVDYNQCETVTSGCINQILWAHQGVYSRAAIKPALISCYGIANCADAFIISTSPGLQELVKKQISFTVVFTPVSFLCTWLTLWLLITFFMPTTTCYVYHQDNNVSEWIPWAD